jgi:hypothetical protein
MIFASSIARRFDLMGSMLPQVESTFRGFGATQVPYYSITKAPPAPTSLKGFLKASVKFRWSRAYGTIARKVVSKMNQSSENDEI